MFVTGNDCFGKTSFVEFGHRDAVLSLKIRNLSKEKKNTDLLEFR